MESRTPTTRAVGAALTIAALTAGCASTDSDASDNPSDASTTSPTSVSIILDWTPNTNHTGIYVAQELGYYAEAGLDVKILPFSQSGVEPVLVAGEADFGISGSSALIPARATGQNLRAVEIVVAKPALAIGYAADRTDITTPSDLDGKVYAGFGLAWEQPLVQTVIRSAGGTGDFSAVSLSTSAYEAVYTGAADFALPLVTWEGIEAEEQGTPLNYFLPSDYGVPPDYPLLIASSDTFLDENPEVAAAFVQATQRGYAYAADNPRESADILLAANPDVLKNPELVYASQDLLSAEYYRDDEGRIGFSDPDLWADYAQWLFEAGVLTDANGDPASAPPATEDLYTNDLLSGS